MVTIGMNYKVRQGKAEVFEKAFHQVAEAMGVEAGHLKSRLFHQVGEEGSYLILSEWQSREAFDQFVASEAFARVTQWGKSEVLEGRPHHDYYNHEG